MTKEQFEAERDYQLALYMIEALCKQEIIDDEEFKSAREYLLDDYQPVISSLIGEL